MFPDAVEEVVEKLNLFFLMLYEIYFHSIRKLTIHISGLIQNPECLGFLFSKEIVFIKLQGFVEEITDRFIDFVFDQQDRFLWNSL